MIFRVIDAFLFREAQFFKIEADDFFGFLALYLPHIGNQLFGQGQIGREILAIIAKTCLL